MIELGRLRQYHSNLFKRAVSASWFRKTLDLPVAVINGRGREMVAVVMSPQQYEFYANALQNKRGDDSCWVDDLDTAKALPECEFLESCRRWREQLEGVAGLFDKGRTIAQLEMENDRLRDELRRSRAILEDIRERLGEENGKYREVDDRGRQER